MDPILKQDIPSILLLLLLYIIQGIPLELMNAVPLLIARKYVNYSDQAMFSFAIWPYTLKLLWAPIVDSMYIESFGRRKTWLVPVQFLIGIFMLILSVKIDELMDSMNIVLMTIVFFILNFLTATQDIAVDAWALTMLRRENIDYASTCHSVGETISYLLGYVLFLALESPTFCNDFFRTVPEKTGFVTLSGYLFFWTWVVFITTTGVAFLKKERPEPNLDKIKLNVKKNYQMLWKVMNLTNVKSLALFTLTSRIGFAAADSVMSLKLIELGVPAEQYALLSLPMIPLQIILPFIIPSYGSRHAPMDGFIKAFPIRTFLAFLFAIVVWYTPNFKLADGSFPFSYFIGLIILYGINQVAVYFMHISQMAFFTKISDPAVGGSYVTLLNTISNIAGNWPNTFILWMVDPLSKKQCSKYSASNDCSNEDLAKKCKSSGGVCDILVDGYYIETVVCMIIAFVWFFTWGKRTIMRLQSEPEASWRVVSSTNVRRDD